MFALAVAGDAGLRLYRCETGETPMGGGRGEIRGFSPSARRRLIDRLMMLPWRDWDHQTRHDVDAQVVLLTLTYPAEYPEDAETVHRHLANFHRALEHVQHGHYWAIWRMEFQKRGAPHFHILLGFDRRISVTRFELWAKATWSRVVGSGDPLHERHGADVVPVTTSKGARAGLMCYLVKYLGKVCETQNLTGRIWGAWGQPPDTVRVAATFETREAYVEFLRRVRKWGKRSKYLRRIHGVSGLRMYCYGPGVLMQLARQLPGADVYCV